MGDLPIAMWNKQSVNDWQDLPYLSMENVTKFMEDEQTELKTTG